MKGLTPENVIGSMRLLEIAKAWLVGYVNNRYGTIVIK